MSKNKNIRSADAGNQKNSPVFIALKAFTLGLLCCLGLVLLFARILSSADVPLYAAIPFSTLSASLGVLIAAFYAGKSVPAGGILWGLLLAASFYLLLLAAALLYGTTRFGLVTGSRILALMVSGALGGLWGTRHRIKKQQRRAPLKKAAR